jgi:hypothetical protein
MLIFIYGSSAKSQALQKFMRTFGRLSISCLRPLFRRSKPRACFGTERYSPKFACFHFEGKSSACCCFLSQTACVESRLIHKHWQLGFKICVCLCIYVCVCVHIMYIYLFLPSRCQFKAAQECTIPSDWKWYKLSLLWRDTCKERVYCTDVTEISRVCWTLSLKCIYYLHEFNSTIFFFFFRYQQ